jgi:hypothetical protein
MAVQFMNMPAVKHPENATLDLASLARPLFQGLNQYSQGVNNAAILDQDKQIGQTASTQGYGAAGKQALSMGRLDEGAKLAQAGQGQQDALRKRYGALAQQVDMEADPARRSAMWQGTLERMKREGAALGLQGEYDPEEMDPATGPKLFMAQAGLVNDPLERQKTQAEINKLNAQAASEGTSGFGKTGNVVMGPDGKYYSVRYAADGTERINPLALPGGQNGAPTPLTPARGVDVVGDQMYDKATGAPVRNVGQNIAGGEQQKQLGKGTAEGQLALPKTQTALRDYEIKSGLVNDSIDTALQQAGPWTTGFAGNLASFVAGTPAHDLSKTLTAIQSNLGFDTLQQMRDNSPTGGALGSITEKELELLQATWGSLVQSQSEQQFRGNLMRLKQIKSEYAALKRDAYARDVARFGAGNVPNPNAGGDGSDLQGRGNQPFVQPDFSTLSDDDLLRQLGGQ